MQLRWKDYRSALLEIFEQRKLKNNRYSLRAFSRDLGISSSRLSEILHGKVGLSLERALEICEKMDLTADDKSLFCDLVESQHARSAIAKRMALQRISERDPNFAPLASNEEKTAAAITFVYRAEHSLQIRERIAAFQKELVKDFSANSETSEVGAEDVHYFKMEYKL